MGCEEEPLIYLCLHVPAISLTVNLKLCGEDTVELTGIQVGWMAWLLTSLLLREILIENPLKQVKGEAGQQQQ